ncbi:hypothetical protein [Kitasatospora sp. NBC_01302]|uniref:hypothetical protein n=1 Tax=Kitasatospora sp. NBC_01302 TaxID=2903575 RepID=UPI002E1375E5|nr:hypothetical protein OG294_39745 [Kitasatospora sp. NBC_01302]
MLDLSLLPVPMPLGLSADQRLVILGVITHLAAGAVYVALTGLSGTRVPIRRREIGTGPLSCVVVLAVWAAAVALWPVSLVCRSLRSLRSLRRRVEGPGTARVRDETPPPPAQARAVLIAGSVPPEWYWREYRAVSDGLAGRLPWCTARAGALMERSAQVFGVRHPYTRDAWELLARAAHTTMAVEVEGLDDGVYVTTPPAAA